MDTDDLSKEAYKGILGEAEKLTENLTLQYGLLSDECKDETEYLEKAKKLTYQIMKLNDTVLDDLFFGNPPEKKDLQATLKKIIDNIEKVQKTPIQNRHYDF